MTNGQHRELQVLSTTPCHETNVVYPARVTSNTRSNRFFVPPAENAANRFYPSALVLRRRVIKNTDRLRWDETMLSSRKAAIFSFAQSFEADPERGQVRMLTLRALARHTAYVQCFVGQTDLHVSTVFIPGAGGDFLVRVGRQTVIHLREIPGFYPSRHVADVGYYQFAMSTLRRKVEQARQNGDIPIWALMMVQAISRSNDVAVRHVDVVRELHELPALGDDGTWRARRTEEVADSIAGQATVVDHNNLNIADRSCLTCGYDYGSPEAPQALALRCSASHTTCFDCIARWAEQQTAANATCPQCRAPLFDAAEQIEIAHGLVNGLYVNDVRFTPWENFQRSCADLDERLPEDVSGGLLVNSDLLFRAFLVLVRGAELEDEGSTPFHLQIVRTADFRQVVTLVSGLLAPIMGYRLKVTRLRNWLFRGIFIGFSELMLREGLAEFMENGARGSRTNEGRYMMLERFLRPGLVPFVERLLDRTIQFVRLRGCGCGADGFHKHGDRAFYEERLRQTATAEIVRPLDWDLFMTIAESDPIKSDD